MVETEKFTCRFERDYIPKASDEAERLYQDARTFDREMKAKNSEDQRQLTELYIKAAQLDHVKAMINLSSRYRKGLGVKRDPAEALKIYQSLAERGVPAAYYGLSLLVDKGAAFGDSMQYLKKSADLGSAIGQYELGRHIMFITHDNAKAMPYLVCALRQGYADAGQELGFALMHNEKNPVMGAEYYWRAVAFGSKGAAIQMSVAFDEQVKPETHHVNYGFKADQVLSDGLHQYFKIMLKDNQARFPHIFEEHPIPKHPKMTYENARKRPSVLKDVFGGQWPHEIFPELMPGYLPLDDFRYISD